MPKHDRPSPSTSGPAGGMNATEPTIGQVQEADEIVRSTMSDPRLDVLQPLAATLLGPAFAHQKPPSIADLVASRPPGYVLSLAGASLGRILAHSPETLSGQTWRPRVVAFVGETIGPALNVDTKAQGFVLEQALASAVGAAENQLTGLLSQNYLPSTLQHLHKGLMKAINSAAGRAILKPFLSDRLTGMQLTSMHHAVEAYVAAVGLAKVDAYQAAAEIVDSYADEALAFGTTYARALADVALVIRAVIRQDFEASKYSKPALLELALFPKKYPLAAVGQRFNLILDVRNVGLGPAETVELTLEASDNVELVRSSIFLGEIDRGVRVETPCRTTTAEPIAVITGQLTWQNVDHTLGSLDLYLTLESQRSDIPWDELATLEPYSLQPVSGEDQLVGRSDMLASLVAEARQRDVGSFFLFGQKRVGKTSIARTLASRLRSSNYAVVYLEGGDYVDPDAATTVANLGRRLCREIKATDSRFALIGCPDFREALGPITDFLSDVLRMDPDFRILVILDEFDELPLNLYRRGPIGDSFFLTLRSVSGRPNFGFVLVGGEKMEFILSGQGDALNKFQAMRVDYFDRENHWNDFAELVRRPVHEWLEFTEEALHRLYDATAGNPYFTKLLCRTLFRRVVSRRDNYITDVEVDQVIAETAQSLSSNSFQHFWEDGILEVPDRVEQISVDRRKVLRAVSQSLQGGAAIRDVVLTHARDITLSSGAATTLLADLVRRQVLVDEGGLYRFKVGLFERWLLGKGAQELLTTFMDPDAIALLRAADESFAVRSDEVVQLVNGWGTYKGQRITEDRVRAWLDQFAQPRERRLMFDLLRQVRFYGPDLIREKLAEAHGIVRRGLRRELDGKQRRAREVVVSYLDGPGKSGATYARLYADENRLLAERVMERDKVCQFILEHDEVQAVVFVDDFVGTGDSASGLLRKLAAREATVWPSQRVRT